MVYYFKYFVNTEVTTTTTCKGQIFSCYLIILPKYLCAKVFTFQYTVTDIPSRLAVTESGTGTWDLGRGDSGTWGRGDVGTWGLGDSGTWGRGDAGTRGLGDSGTWRRGTWGHIFTICLTFHHISQNLRLLIVTALFPGLSPSFV